MPSAESPKEIPTLGCARGIGDEDCSGAGIQIYVDSVLADGEILRCGICPVRIVGGETSGEDAAIQVAKYCMFLTSSQISGTSES